MTWAYWASGAVAGMLLLYLLAAMLRPEKF